MSELTAEQEKELELRKIYRNIFFTIWQREDGKRFLKDLFVNHLMTFRDDIKGEGELAISNLGRKLWGYMGCSDIEVSVDAQINAQLSVPSHISQKPKEKKQ